MLNVKEWLVSRKSAQFRVLRLAGVEIDFISRISDNLRFSRLLKYSFIKDKVVYKFKFLTFHNDLIHTSYVVKKFDYDTNELLAESYFTSEIDKLEYHEEITSYLKEMKERSLNA